MTVEIFKKESNLTARINVYADPQLKKLAIQEAVNLSLPLSELCCRALAQYLGRPDLATVPRGRPGRKLQIGERP
jgi:hypothetical protein